MIFIPLEIGVRGIINQENKTSIEDIAHYTVMSSPKALGKSLSRESVIASYYISYSDALLAPSDAFFGPLASRKAALSLNEMGSDYVC